MLKAGHVIDIYDDAEGVHVKDGELLKKYGELQVTPPSDLQALPDRDFALVIFTKTGEKHRKFPIQNPASVALSLHYFEKTGAELPEMARAIAATNLLGGHLRFGAEPPEDLRKLAADNVVGPYFNAAEDREDNNAFFQLDLTPKKYALKKQLCDERTMELFPIGTAEETKASAAALKKVGFDLPPRDRYAAVFAVQKRLQEFKLAADEDLSKIASVTPNPAFLTHIEARKAVLKDDENRKALDTFAKVAADKMSPYVAAALEEFDHRTGLHHYWDHRIRNPWDSCFQSKEAGLKVGDKSITKKALLALIDSGKLSGLFKESTLKDFRKMPLEVFQSLPNPTKQTIAGMIG